MSYYNLQQLSADGYDVMTNGLRDEYFFNVGEKR